MSILQNISIFFYNLIWVHFIFKNNKINSNYINKTTDTMLLFVCLDVDLCNKQRSGIWSEVQPSVTDVDNEFVM